MAMAASLQIKNNTGGDLIHAGVTGQRRRTRSAPGPGDVSNNDASVTIAMGNSSFLSSGASARISASFRRRCSRSGNIF